MAALPTAPSAPAPLVDPDGHLPLWRRMLRHLLGGLVVSLSVGVFIALIFGEGLWPNLVISVCIGGCIQGLIEAGRYTIAAWMRRHGDTRPHVLKNWPGWPLMGPWVLVSALLGYGLGRNLGAILLGMPWPVHTGGGNLRVLALVLGITVAVSAAATWNFFLRSQVATSAAQAEAARRLAGESQLRLLQSQLEPHMLFNTLANLRVLVGLDPPRAQVMLDHLIRYLRATLGASHANLHPLATEFALLDDYLALMALRMGPRLQVQLDLPEPLRRQPVPPLLLQPLVENAIRHGLEPQVAGGRITVRAEAQGARLRLTVRDTGAGLADHNPAPAVRSDGGGYGTRHVADRLATLYGAEAGFRLQPAPDADGGTLAEVLLPLAAGTPTA
jgi:hypothetical protein